MLKPLLVILVGLFFAGTSYKNMRDDQALEDHGATAFVQPLKEYTEKTSRRTQHKSYSADLTFQTEAGETITVNKPIDPDTFDTLMGGRMQIRYLPEAPHITRIGNEGKSGSADVWIGIVILIVGGLWFHRRLKAD